MRAIRDLFLPAVAAVVLSAGSAGVSAGDAAATVDERKPLYLLTIGNSFSDDSTRLLPEVAKASKTRRLELRRWASLGGHSLKQHAGYLAAWRADPTDPKGRPYNVPETLSPDKKADLVTILKAEPWDVVTIQQLSPDSWRPETYFPFAAEVADAVREYAPQAKLVMQETWAYRADDPWLVQQNMTWKEMYARVKGAYAAAAAKLGIELLPVGDAYAAAVEDPAWGYETPAEKPTAETVQHPASLDAYNVGSLHVGYFWRKKDNKDPESPWVIGYDPRHASRAGQYLGALIWYERIIGESCLDVAFVPNGVTPERADYLRKLAHRTVEEYEAGLAAEPAAE